MERLDLLAERIAQAAREYAQLEAGALSRVQSWRWGSSPLYHLKPNDFQRSGHSPGRLSLIRLVYHPTAAHSGGIYTAFRRKSSR